MSKNLTIKEALRVATKKFKSYKIPSAPLDAEVILSHVINKPKEYLYTYSEKKLRASQTKRFNQLIKRRSHFEPVAYLTGHKEFYGLDFLVNKNVLIPRPETELLIEQIVGTIHELSLPNKLTIADIGTGSGCIAITLKKLLPKAKIYATDISKKALITAKKNAQKHRLKINFLKGNLLKPLKNKRLDIIVANLPYLTDKKKNSLKSLKGTSLKYEPKIAWAGGKYGLAIYKRFFKQLSQRAKPKIVICEIGQTYLKELKKLINKYFSSSQIKIKKDLAGLNRVLIIEKI